MRDTNYSNPDSPSELQPRFYYGCVIVMAAFFIFLVIIGISYTFGIFFKPILEEFGRTMAAISGAFSIAIFTSSISGITLGIVADRFGNKLTTGAGLLIMTLSFPLIIIFAESSIIYIFAVIFGFASGGVIISHSPTIATLFGLRAHGRILGMSSMGFSIGCRYWSGFNGSPV